MSLSFSRFSRLLYLIPGLLLLSLPFLVRALHRIDGPPPLPAATMVVALEVAHAAVRAGAGEQGEALADAPRDLEAPVTGPVFVTVYGVGSTGRQEPPLGASSFDPAHPPTLAAALQEAGTEAGRRLRTIAGALDKLPTARIKIDLVGVPGAGWSDAPSYLEAVMDPGRDGLMARVEGKEAWYLPSWSIERGQGPREALSWLRSRLAVKDGGLELARFRTFAFIDGTPDEPGPLEVFRGNVLVPEVSTDTVRRSLALAGGYLARSVKPDGRFCYTYFAGRDRCDTSYNLLRHAGTAYSMYQIYQVVPEPATLEAAERAMEWLRQQVRPVDGDPSRAYMIEGDKAKLGAVGLGLLAFVEREKVVKDGRDRALMVRLADFIRSQQREDGYLESWFAWRPGIRLPPENSIYYPGEALLGLVRLYGIDPQPRYLETAVKAAGYLALKRWRWAGIELYVPPDAWLTQALAELHGIRQDAAFKDYTYELIEVTTTTMLRREEGAPPDMAGGPAGGMLLPSVTPAGSRNEGMTAAWAMARAAGDTEKAAWLREFALRSAGFQLNQQFRPANGYFLRNLERALGGFRSRADALDVRIDYVQHNATGLVGLLPILEMEGR